MGICLSQAEMDDARFFFGDEIGMEEIILAMKTV
jgi:hypothetical protein